MKIKLLFIVFILLLGSFNAFAQVRIQMQKEGGVYKIPCIVNGLRLKFIFDTGASVVSISLSEANLMLDNGYLDKSDIVGTGKAQIADGSIVNNTKIILREIKIDDLVLNNVEAVVINEQKAPLLLGQSAIEKLGKIQIDGDELIIINANSNDYTEEEIDEMFNQAFSYYKDELFTAAADLIQQLYNLNRLSTFGVKRLADSYYYSNQYSKALDYYLKIEGKIAEFGSSDHEVYKDNFLILSHIGVCSFNLKDYSKAELYYQKSKQYAKSDFENSIYYGNLVRLYEAKNDCYLMRVNIEKEIEYEVKYQGFTHKDVFSGKARNKKIATVLYLNGYRLITCGYKEGTSMICTAAKYGNPAAIDYCEAYSLDYKGYKWN